MWIYKALSSYSLPASRNTEKDTLEYMVYMHSRPEIMEDAISENPWDSAHFAWIDFNAPRLFRKRESFQILKDIARHPYSEDACFFAGCWPKLDGPANIATQIHWRFCGAFYLASIQSHLGFADLYRSAFPEFIESCGGIFPWEVNYWAWLEWKKSEKWRPTWYHGDHNDQMLNVLAGISADTYATALGFTSAQEYDYPKIDPFLPGSASYLEHDGRHYLNTRFVNYWMYPSGYYRFHSPDMVIENRNFLSELDATTMTPTDFREMDETTLYGMGGAVLEKPARDKRAFSVGLEDIRLFSGANGEIRFIATNVEYSPSNKNRMIVGTYDLTGAKYRDCLVVVPPDPNSWCEKNWIPIVFHGEEMFIYKWQPMEIGKIDPATHQLNIVLRHETPFWIFSRLRGSSGFVDSGEYLVGVAHFSEEHSPRHYYHVLVFLDKTTLKPVKHSRVFYFEKLSIEFCIGFRILRRDSGCYYVFWISRFDREPICVEIPTKELD
jgi:hypothetical protein